MNGAGNMSRPGDCMITRLRECYLRQPGREEYSNNQIKP